jgi:hypothetical protein
MSGVAQLVKMGAKGVDALVDALRAGKKAAPQDEALALAQQRAALPIEQGGLGLPPTNTAMDRAKAMGFDTPAYHGTAADVKSFDLSKAGTQMNSDWGNAAYLTPDPSNASYYATEAGAKNIKNAAFEQYEKLARGLPRDDPQGFKLLNDYRAAARAAEATPEKANVMPLLMNTRNAVSHEVVDGMTDPNLYNTLRMGQNNKDIATIMNNPTTVSEYAVFNPDKIRSRFAAFDPWRKTAAVAATMGVAAPNLLAEELRKK